MPRAFGHAPRVIEQAAIRNIALVGFMGTGKSTVGRQAARGLGFEFVDTDMLIEEEAGLPVGEIFSQAGEATFRKMERRVVDALGQREKLIIATGGGLIVNEDNRASLKTHAMIICLWASPEAIWKRTRHQKHRPLLNDPDPQARIAELLAEREPHYRQADIIINTELRPIREVAQQVVHQFRETVGQMK